LLDSLLQESFSDYIEISYGYFIENKGKVHRFKVYILSKTKELVAGYNIEECSSDFLSKQRNYSLGTF